MKKKTFAPRVLFAEMEEGVNSPVRLTNIVQKVSIYYLYCDVFVIGKSRIS